MSRNLSASHDGKRSRRKRSRSRSYSRSRSRTRSRRTRARYCGYQSRHRSRSRSRSRSQHNSRSRRRSWSRSASPSLSLSSSSSNRNHSRYSGKRNYRSKRYRSRSKSLSSRSPSIDSSYSSSFSPPNRKEEKSSHNKHKTTTKRQNNSSKSRTSSQYPPNRKKEKSTHQKEKISFKISTKKDVDTTKISHTKDVKSRTHSETTKYPPNTYAYSVATLLKHNSLQTNISSKNVLCDEHLWAQIKRDISKTFDCITGTFATDSLEHELIRCMYSSIHNDSVNTLHLLDKYETLTETHLLLFRQIDSAIVPKRTGFKYIALFGDHLWFDTLSKKGVKYEKINSRTKEQCIEFVKSKPCLLKEWQSYYKQNRGKNEVVSALMNMFIDVIRNMLKSNKQEATAKNEIDATKKVQSTAVTKLPSKINKAFYALENALSVAINNKKAGKEYETSFELLNKFDKLNLYHLELLNKLESKSTIKVISFQMKHLVTVSNHDMLWMQSNNVLTKIKAATAFEWHVFLESQDEDLLHRWHRSLAFLKTNSKRTVEKKAAKMAGSKETAIYKTVLMFLQAMRKYFTYGSNNYSAFVPDRKSVGEWSYYAVIYWLNRVHDGALSDIKYVNLRKHVVMGKVRGNQLCHINDVTLNMIGFYDTEDIDLILNEISELIREDSFDNAAANVLLTDDVPVVYCDAISFELMDEPMIVSGCGNVYDRMYIEEYFRKHKQDPLTQKRIKKKHLMVDQKLQKRINTWKLYNCIHPLFE